MIRVNAAAWHGVLTGPGDHRLRPAPGKWSALEYGCHVRDVLRLYDQRLSLMLTEDGPPVHHLYDVTGTRHTTQQ